jgi:mono/diheme cytochrome c family protein
VRKLALKSLRNISLLAICYISIPFQAFAEDCPQPRNIKSAPESFLKMTNPLELSPKIVSEGRDLYMGMTESLACVNCHGPKGDSKGELGMEIEPPPRNFTCGETMKTISDGQMFWVIKNGSPNQLMMGYDFLGDEIIWKIISFVRTFSR